MATGLPCIGAGVALSALIATVGVDGFSSTDTDRWFSPANAACRGCALQDTNQ